MSGTPAGGRKAAKKLKATNPEYYSELAQKAKRVRSGVATAGSFTSETAKLQAAKGGRASKRPKAKEASQRPADGPLPELSL